jgi:metallo-beta-lactamase family protein
MKLQFLGAAETVTGSRHLLRCEKKTLLIDCGMFQGHKSWRLKNWESFPVPIDEIDAIVLTHAHIDHSGYLPRLVKLGYQGPIYSTKATADLAEILLRDAGRIQEEDARRANRYGYSKHKPALPLFTEDDAIDALKLFKIIDREDPVSLGGGVKLHADRAGHILGSSILTIQERRRKIVFSGDLGRPHDPIIKPPSPIYETDYLVLESTYGERLHPETDPEEELSKVIRETAKGGGVVLIPAFAVGRTQLMLYFLHKLKEKKQIPDIPIYLDSPMAQDATDILAGSVDEHHLEKTECKKVCSVAHYVRSVEESKKLLSNPLPKIIVAASGMVEGGRILHHIKHYGPYHQNAIVFTGFQASMTRGDRILRGEREVKIHGRMVPIRARVEMLDSLSSHADYSEILDWLKNFDKPPKKVFLVHGEPSACESLKEHIVNAFGWDVAIPNYLESFDLK